MNGVGMSAGRVRPAWGAAVSLAAVVAGLLVPVAATAATEPAPDGLSQETAAASCWEIKQNDPDAADGVYWLVTPELVYPQQFFCDQTTDGGGWVLIGRGREGWKEGYNGLRTPQEISATPSGTAAFKTAQLPATTVDGLLNGERPDALPDGVRVHRAADAAGTSWQDVNLHVAQRDRWVWTFGAVHRMGDFAFGATPNSVAATGSGGTTSSFGTDEAYNRVHFDQAATHQYLMGWAYGSSITGSIDASSYLWAPDGQGSARPFAQAYLRPQLRLADLDFGSVPATGTPASTLPAIPHSGAVKTTWGVSGLANGAAGENNVEVAAFGETAGKVFVGGNFRFVQQTRDGAGQVEQPYLASFDVATGEWVSTFRPVLDGQVKAIQALPDGRVAIGGQFTTVNGVAQAGLAFLDPETGELDGWQVTAEDRNAGGPAYIHALDVQGDDLYVAGAMTHLTAVGSTTSASTWNGGRINLATHEPDTAWNPFLNGTSMSVDASDRGDRVYFSGYFRTKEGVSTPSAVALQTTAGAPLADPLWTPQFSKVTINADGTYTGNIWQLGVKEVGDRIWLGGSEHSLVSYDRDTFERLSGSITRAGGDFQTVQTNGSIVVGGCHCGDYVYHDSYSYTDTQDGWSEADKINLMGAWDAKTGAYIPDWSPTVQARAGYGAWASFFDSTGTLWVGGDFDTSLLADQSAQWSGGFIRFAPRDATAPTTPGALSAAPDATGEKATLSWGSATDDGGVTYEVLRGSRVIASTTSRSYAVPVTADPVDYVVRARDAVGNRSASTAMLTVQAEQSAPAPLPVTGLTSVPGETSVALSWTAAAEGTAATSYEIARDGVVVGTVTAPATTFTDTGLTAATGYTYTVVAKDADGQASTAVSAEVTTTAKPVPDTTPVSIPAGSTWSWRYSADPLPADWNTVGFDASGWSTGAAVFGRGYTKATTDIDPAKLPAKPVSAQFRTAFTVKDAVTVKDGTVSVIADDGVVVYLNGVEIGRAGMAPGTVTATTTATASPASPAAGKKRVTFTVPAALLTEGTNVIAASVHGKTTASDLSFDLALTMPR